MGIIHKLSDLLRDTILVATAKIIGKFLALIGNLILIRELHPSDFGTLSLVFSIVSVVGGVLVLGIPEGSTRLISAADNKLEKRNLISVSLISGVTVGVIGFLGFGFSIPFIASFFGIYDRIYLEILSVYLLIFPLSAIVIGVLRATDYAVASLMSRDVLANGFAIVSFFVSIYLLNQSGIVSGLLFYLTIPLSTLIVSLVLLSSLYPLRSIIKRIPPQETFAEVFQFSWPLALESMLLVGMANADILLLGYFLHPKSVGFYKAAVPLSKVSMLLLSSTVFLFTPIATNYYEDNKYSELNEFYTRVTKWVVYGTVPVVVSVALFSEPIVLRLYMNEYLPAAPVLSILVAGTFFRVLVGPNGAMIKSINRPKVDLFASSSSFIINILLNLALIPVFGLIGAATATILGYIVYNIIEIYVIYSEVGVHPFRTKIMVSILFPLCGGLITKVVFEPQSMNELIGISILLYGIMLIGIILTRSIDERDREIFRSFLEV